MIVIKTSIPHHRISNPTPCGIGVEVMAVQLKLHTIEMDIYNIYRKERQTLDMGELLSHATRQPCLVVGDLNAHHPILRSPSNTNAAGIHLAQLLEDLPLIKLLNDGQPTHNRGGRLDLTFTTDALASEAEWSLHPTLTSDHFAIQIELQLDRPETPLPPPKWNIQKADWGLFRATMDNWWANYSPPEDLNQREADFTQAITNAADTAIPKTTPSHKFRKNWWFYSPEIKEINRRLSDARKMHKQNPCPETIAMLREVAHHKRQITRDLRTKRWLEWCASFNKNTSLGTLWEKLRIATGRPPPRRPAHNDPQGEAERLADLFQARGSTEMLPQEIQFRQEALQPSRTLALQAACEATSPTDEPFVMQELLQARKGRRDTASGSDGIRYSMLQYGGPSSDAAFLSLMNQSWREGRMPHSWKEGDIVVVEKPGTPNCEPKLRPLTLLKCPGKTAELMVLPRLQWQIGQLHHNIFGFVQGKSTTDCIMTFLALIDNRESIAVYLDLEKAFELANPAAILEALVNKGVRGHMLSWIEDYLHGRRSRVKFQGTTSNYREIQNGTPQGGPLSPTLFNLLVEVLVSLLLPRGAHLISYADDLVLVVTRVANKHMIAQKALNQIAKKCEDLGLKISAVKSKAMHLFPGKGAQYRRLTIQGTHLEWVKTHLYLGIWIDQRLTFKTEVEYLKDRTNARVNVMRAMTNPTAGASPEVLRLFYVHAIRPLIDYAAPAIIDIAKTWQDNLETIQNAAMRTILGAPKWTKIGTMQAETGIVPLHLRIKQLTAGRVARILQRDKTSVVRNCLAGFYDPAYNDIRRWGPKTAAAFAVMVEEGPQLATNPDLPDPSYNPPPPWEPPAIIFTFTPLPGTRAECSEAEMKQHALQAMAEQHLLSDHIYYTDGSVDPSSGAAGSAFITNGLITAWRNTSNTSSLQTELAAIEGALTHLEGGPDISVTIHTDSKASIQTLQRKHHTDNISLVTAILGRAQTLSAQGTRICINWIPSHVGLAGNERADEAAREATHLQEVSKHIRPSLSHMKENARNKTRALTRHIHNRMTNTSPSMKWYHDVTEFIPLPPNTQQSRETVVAIQRLRLGYKTLAEIQPERGTLNCAHCGTRARIPLRHYLLHCPATTQLRTPQIEEGPEGRAAYAAALVKRACEDPKTLQAVLKRAPPPR